MNTAWMWRLAACAVVLPVTGYAQSQFALAARGGYTGFTGSDFSTADRALILDLGLRYGRRHGLSGGVGGHFSNHTVTDSIELDAVGVYAEARYTGPTVSTNVLPFVTVRAGYAQHSFTVGRGAATQNGSQDGWMAGATLGAALDLAERLDVEIAGVYSAVRLGDANTNGNPEPGSDRRGGQWSVLVGVVFRTGG